MIWKMEAGSIDALMRTPLINARPVIQLTFHQTKKRGCFIAAAPSVDLPQRRKVGVSLFEASADSESLPLFCRV